VEEKAHSQSHEPQPKYQVRAIDRATSLLGCFSSERPELGVVELAEMTDISRGTAHRLLSSLAHHRLVQQDPVTRRYRLGLRLFELGNLVLANLQPVELAKPYLERLVTETGETAHMAIMDEGMAIYVAKVESRFSIRMGSIVGQRHPCHCTGLGKVLLAYDSRGVDAVGGENGLVARTRRTITDRDRLRQELMLTRERGYSVDDEEFEDGLRCIAAPVFDHTGTVVAAISVSGPTARITEDAVAELAGTTVNMAKEISLVLGA
jgi:DNA-binding IclR family transcriptional regulator